MCACCSATRTDLHSEFFFEMSLLECRLLVTLTLSENFFQEKVGQRLWFNLCTNILALRSMKSNKCQKVSTQNCAQESKASHEASVHCLHDHLGRGRSGIAPNARTNQSPRAAARRDRAPSEQQRQSCAGPMWWSMPRLSLGGGNSVSRTNQLGTHRLFSLAGTQQRRSIHNLAARLRCAVPLQRRNESGGRGELRSITMAICPSQIPGDERPPGLVAQGPDPSPSRSS